MSYQALWRWLQYWRRNARSSPGKPRDNMSSGNPVLVDPATYGQSNAYLCVTIKINEPFPPVVETCSFPAAMRRRRQAMPDL